MQLYITASLNLPHQEPIVSTTPENPTSATPPVTPPPDTNWRRRRRRRILLLLLLIIGGFLGYISSRPDEFQVTRSIAVAAPPEQVYGLVSDFHKWENWSPWAKLDPNSKATFEGPESGPGAVFKWNGNSEVGEGQMTIKDVKPNEQVLIELKFIRPMEDTCETIFDFTPEGDGTQVKWTMQGKQNFMGKLVCFFMNMDQMVGKDFEKGLQSMKSVAEAPPAS